MKQPLFVVITPVYCDTHIKYASTLRTIQSLNFVPCPWLQVEIRNGKLDKVERSNDSNMHCYETRIALHGIVRPVLTGKAQTSLLL